MTENEKYQSLLSFVRSILPKDKMPISELIRLSNLNGENIGEGYTADYDEIDGIIEEAVWQGSASVRARNALDILQLLHDIGEEPWLI